LSAAGLHVVVMGVAGCGKSAVGQGVARQLGLPLIEGDGFHPDSNIEKMRHGVALTDEDRADWLRQLGEQLRKRPGGAVLTCSALKAAYRDVLRSGRPGLRFVHLALTQQQALQRVAARSGHFYPPSLVASQFEALQDPAGEPGVLVVDATLALDEVIARVLREFNNP
jgi:gluconokinase